jgi:2-dehydro-3-deoxyphosphogluconate aldolase/(4S)-4-hydroxy-2-oxoglutarate aldolase
MGASADDILRERRLLPVVVLQRAADAAPLAKALKEGGLPLAEITFRTAAAAASIEAIRRHEPGVRVGAGTVSSVAQVDEAIGAGAEFLVTPGFNPKVVERALAKGIPIYPGVNAPGFIEMALEFGLSTLKFFPAEASGGIAMIKALSGPYPSIRFIPTGGVGPANLSAYLATPSVLACGGSWMVDAKLIASGDFAGIAKLTAEAVALAASPTTERH